MSMLEGQFARAGPNQSRGEKLEERQLSSGDFSDVVFWSYYYSQGGPELQRKIFAYIARKHPEWKVTAETKEEARAQTTERAAARVRSAHPRTLTGNVISREAIEEDVNLRLSELAAALNAGVIPKQHSETHDKLVQVDETDNVELLHSILARDIHFSPTLMSKLTLDGRTRRPYRGEHTGGVTRPRMSHFVEYAVDGERAPGPAVYGEMMLDMKETYEKLKAAPTSHERTMIVKWAEEMIAYHRKHNPPKSPES